MKAIISEYLVSCNIDSWDEVKVEHKKISNRFLKSIMKDIRTLDFVSNCYIATNGLIRIDIEGITASSSFSFLNDVAIHPNRGHFTIIRHGELLKKYEDMIINFIISKLENL